MAVYGIVGSEGKMADNKAQQCQHYIAEKMVAIKSKLIQLWGPTDRSGE